MESGITPSPRMAPAADYKCQASGAIFGVADGQMTPRRRQAPDEYSIVVEEPGVAVESDGKTVARGRDGKNHAAIQADASHESTRQQGLEAGRGEGVDFCLSIVASETGDAGMGARAVGKTGRVPTVLFPPRTYGLSMVRESYFAFGRKCACTLGAEHANCKQAQQLC
jgi:hypothetical protein